MSSVMALGHNTSSQEIHVKRATYQGYLLQLWWEKSPTHLLKGGKISDAIFFIKNNFLALKGEKIWNRLKNRLKASLLRKTFLDFNTLTKTNFKEAFSHCGQKKWKVVVLWNGWKNVERCFKLMLCESETLQDPQSRMIIAKSSSALMRISCVTRDVKPIG